MLKLYSLSTGDIGIKELHLTRIDLIQVIRKSQREAKVKI
jgi:hypothetical protein